MALFCYMPISVKKASILYITITLLLHPPYFVRSGYLPFNPEYLRNMGRNSELWSSIASSRRFDNTTLSSAYYFEFNIDNILPSNGPNVRWMGFPLRWLGSGGGVSWPPIEWAAGSMDIGRRQL